eukprot:4288154-Amphidinium_carterae.1
MNAHGGGDDDDERIVTTKPWGIFLHRGSVLQVQATSDSWKRRKDLDDDALVKLRDELFEKLKSKVPADADCCYFLFCTSTEVSGTTQSGLFESKLPPSNGSLAEGMSFASFGGRAFQFCRLKPTNQNVHLRKGALLKISRQSAIGTECQVSRLE